MLPSANCVQKEHNTSSKKRKKRSSTSACAPGSKGQDPGEETYLAAGNHTQCHSHKHCELSTDDASFKTSGGTASAEFVLSALLGNACVCDELPLQFLLKKHGGKIVDDLACEVLRVSATRGAWAGCKTTSAVALVVTPLLSIVHN